MDLYLNKKIEHTNLKPYEAEEQLKKTVEEAIRYDFYGVCVPPFFVKKAKELLKDSDIKLITVIGFPNGYTTLKTKLIEATEMMNEGADELDIVWNINEFKSKNYDYVLAELKTIIAYTEPLIHKVIVETAYLTDEEKKRAVEIVMESGAEFIKTSTGFAPKGATIEDVKLFKKLSDGKLKVKAAGGIRDYQTALQFIQAGADRIGTSSGVQIVESRR